MGLYLLNISVDIADPNPEYMPEDLSFNDQESIVEIVVEQVLSFEDAIKEYDDHDTEDHNKKKNVKIDLLLKFIPKNHCTYCQSIEKGKRYPDFEIRLTSAFIAIDSPPPEI